MKRTKKKPETTLRLSKGVARSVAVKLLDWEPQGRRFNPWCGHDKIRTAVRPLSKALNPGLVKSPVSRSG